jgi:hypothetical protein
VLLVAGGNRLSTAIKYLMQSTWSHAALYVGNAIAAPLDAPDGHTLIEVNLGEGCVVVPLASVIATTPASTGRSGSPKLNRAAVIAFMVSRLDTQYDMRSRRSRPVPAAGPPARPVGATDVPDRLPRALRRLFVSLSHRVPSGGYDELRTLPHAISSNLSGRS